MSSYLDEIVQAQKQRLWRGITSICSAHPWVLKAAMQEADILLVESTCNQVNQFGGYSGMTPQAFFAYVHNLAANNSFPSERLIVGGDHLGPNVWQTEPAASAMQKAEDLVRSCVQAGYTKIHLDASMKLGDDDPVQPLDVELIARRTASLAKAAENTSADTRSGSELRYVIGSEVPPPGGATVHEDSVSVTEVADLEHMFEAMHRAFSAEGLEPAWERVIALVVQPGVEFGDDFILDYRPEAAQALVRYAETIPFIFEAHSTDYQKPVGLQRLVRDHFAILKVGPALTFAFREAALALAMMERELFPPAQCSRLIEQLDEAMMHQPAYWAKHYRGTEQEKAFARKYSFSDRIRYYWAQPTVQDALHRLLHNLADKPLPLALVSQFAPCCYSPIRAGRMENSAQAILLERISVVLSDYFLACGGAGFAGG